ncbi:hypothetical protein MRX96_002609 [Rhipicephalus microplus]
MILLTPSTDGRSCARNAGEARSRASQGEASQRLKPITTSAPHAYRECRVFAGVRDTALAARVEAALLQTLHVFSGDHSATLGHRLVLGAQLDAIRGRGARCLSAKRPKTTFP